MLSTGFETPPAKAYPGAYHWWLGGDVDTLRLKEELGSFKKAGISGFTIFEIGSRDTIFAKAGQSYLGKESLAVIKYAITEAGKLGLDVGLNTASSWNAGGTWITLEHALPLLCRWNNPKFTSVYFLNKWLWSSKKTWLVAAFESVSLTPKR